MIDRFSVRKYMLSLTDADAIKIQAQNNLIVEQAYQQLNNDYRKYYKLYLENRVVEETNLRSYQHTIYKKLIVF